MQGMNLRDLIEAARHNYGSKSMSYAGLSDKCGGKPTAARLQQYAKDDLENFPDPESIRGLQRGTGRSQQEIIFASARSLGLQVDSDFADALIIAGLSELPDSAIESMKSVGRELVNLSRKVETHADEPDAASTVKESERPEALPARAQQGSEPVAPADHPGEGQKIIPADVVPDNKGTIIELRGDEAKKYPAPPLEQLATHPKVTTAREHLDETTGERDENT